MERKFLSSDKSRLACGWASFFILSWLWVAWWMGDIFRVAREQSFFAADAQLMHWVLQQRMGWMSIAGRAWLTLARWPVVFGMTVAAALTLTGWAVARVLKLSPRWHVAAVAVPTLWMCWVAWQGFNLYYQSEPGRAFGTLAALAAIAAIVAALMAFAKRRDTTARMSPVHLAIMVCGMLVAVAIPSAITHLRHPYARPVTRMQVQMLHDDWSGMVETAHANASLSYRPLAAFYAIALVHTGHLTDAMFDIRLDYDTLRVETMAHKADVGTGYYIVDCNYTAGLFRAAEHKAMEHLTMNGPTIYSLKHLTRLALIDGAWDLARKYLHILEQTPFESDFAERYAHMVGDADAVAADPEFALLRRTEPVMDSFESQYQEPVFLGYTATLLAGRSADALMQSLMANLYSKRMPDFLARCQPLTGTVPPRTIAEGLVTQCAKNPAILQAFPQLQMNAQTFQGFLRNVQYAMKDRPAHARELFDSYRGYYPYYYYFGNLKATRKPDQQEAASSDAGVN